MTIQQLATALGISRNSVHLQIRKLEAEGVVRKQEPQLSSRAGKPAYRYKTTAGNEDVHSVAYRPLLDVLMQTISADLPDKDRLRILEKTGRSLAKSSGLQAGSNSDIKSDIQKAVDAVNSLGATAVLSSKGKINTVSCHSCPVATLVHREPMTCKLVAAFFSEASGRKVSVQCKKDDTVVCGFTFQ